MGWVQACYEGQGHGMKATSEQDASSLSSFHNITMNGQEVFRFAVRAVPDVSPPLPCPSMLHRPPLPPAFPPSACHIPILQPEGPLCPSLVFLIKSHMVMYE